MTETKKRRKVPPAPGRSSKPQADHGSCASDPAGAEPMIRLVRRMATLFRDRLDLELRPYGITTAQLQILVAVDHDPEVSGAKLARLCRVTPQSTQTLLKTAEGKGWVRRHPHAENERILLAVLTPKGNAVMERARTLAIDLQQHMLRDFGKKEVALLARTLERCIHNLEQP